MLRVYVCPYNTTQPLRLSARDCSFLTSVCVAGCTLPTMYGGSFDASYYGKSKGWAHLIQGKRQFEECTPAQKAESRTWARQSQDKERKRGPRVLPKRGGPDLLRLSCFFSVILAFSWLPWELKLARLPDCQARGD